MTDIFSLRNPKPFTEFHHFNNRLALFHRVKDHLQYWREYWQEPSRSRLISSGRAGNLGEFEHLIIRYVPKNLPVLEAGCGPAHLVAALHTRGYSAIGIDYEPEVVRFANDALPDLDVREGNIMALEFPTGTLGCYLSVGVVEHFVAGPLDALVEARRILHARGIALISVPYLNPGRKAHFQQLCDYPDEQTTLQFHQYYFSRNEFVALLREAGFCAIDYLPYAASAFLCREHPLFSRYWNSPLSRNRTKRAIRRLLLNAPQWLRNRYGHMLMVVCRPIE